MTLLWLCAVCLIALALGLLLPPLFRVQQEGGMQRQALARRVYADQLVQVESDLQAQVLGREDHATVVEDLQRQLLQEVDQPPPGRKVEARAWMGWGVALLLSLGLPTSALLLYQQVGNPRAAAVLAAGSNASREFQDEQDISLLVARLAARLRAQPQDLQGWVMLARSYEVLQRFDDAASAYRQATMRAPKDAHLLADYADAVASAREGDLGGDAQEAIDRALAIDPQNSKALALAGMAAYQRGDLAAAQRHWLAVLAVLPADSEGARSIEGNLAQLGATSAEAAKPPKTDVAGGDPASKRIAGTVSIAPQLSSRVAPQDTVFVVARAPAGGRIPVAVLRLQAKDLPARFVLDDSLAMTPERPLSRFSPLTVEVRVSRSGKASPVSGDLVGKPEEVDLGQNDVLLVIDQQIR